MGGTSSRGDVPTTAKPRLRQEFCELRECMLPADTAASSAAVCQRLTTWSVLREAGTVMTYVAFRNEVDLDSLLDAVPSVRWVIPRVEGKRMVVHAYTPGELVRHRFGMLEPEAGLPVVAPEEIDVVLVPGVAFDRQGGRLGFGGGYYDRFLPTTPAVRVGITHSVCLAEALPCGPLDQRVDWVVTPTELIHCAPLWRRTSEPPPDL